MKTYHVGPKGGLLSLVTVQGEVIELPLAAGAHALATLSRLAGALPFVPTGGKWLIASGNFETCKPIGQFETAANPSFRVSPAARQVREIKRMMARTEALAKRTAKIQSAMTRAKAPESTPAPASEPVITPTPSVDAG